MTGFFFYLSAFKFDWYDPGDIFSIGYYTRRCGMFAHKKIHGAMIIAALLSLGCAGQMFAMQGQPGHLAFVLDGERRVQSCQALGGMKFYKEKAPEDFWGKDIMTLIPLSDSAVEKLDVAFSIAPIDKEAIHVDYTLEETGNFQASIMPVRGLNGAGFVVLVRRMLAVHSAEVGSAPSPFVATLREKKASSDEGDKLPLWARPSQAVRGALKHSIEWGVGDVEDDADASKSAEYEWDSSSEAINHASIDEEIWAPKPWNERQQEG
jgi:hypothetical protein